MLFRRGFIRFRGVREVRSESIHIQRERGIERDTGMPRVMSRVRESLLLLFTMASAPVLLAGCKQLDIDTVWTDDPIIVDGVTTEWSDLETTYLEEKKVLIGLSNDSDNIYILLRFGDPSWIQTMRMGSLTVWLDKAGKKREELGIRYYGGPEPAGIPDRRSPGDIQIIPTRLTVVTKNPDMEVSIPTDGSKGPAAAFRITSGIYTCEISIPLLDETEDVYGIDAEPGQVLMLGLDLKVNRERLAQAGQRGVPGAGRSGGGMIGGRGGSMGGRMPGGMSGMPKEQKLWINTVLAVPPQ